MPLAKDDLFPLLARAVQGVDYPFSTSAVGDASSIIASGAATYGDTKFVQWYPLITSGGESVKWRRCTIYTSSSGDFTVVPDLAGAPGASVTFEMHLHSPGLYSQAFNDAIGMVYPSLLYRPLRNWGGVLGKANRNIYEVPRDFLDLTRVLYPTSITRRYHDTFDRDDSATLMGTSTSGHSATISTGDTFGITSDQLYSVSDTDGDLAIIDDLFVENGFFEAEIIGTLADATTYRVPCLVFRYQDASNYLVIRIRDTTTNTAGAVDLRKVDGGTESSLAEAAFTVADNQYYRVRVQFIGTRITVWVDEQEILNHELVGPNYKYMGEDFITQTYGQIGFRLDTGGAPATAARWRRAQLHVPTTFAPVEDFELTADKRMFIVHPRSGRGYNFLNDMPLIVEGKAMLTKLDAETTPGTIATYTTERVQLTIDTPQVDLLVAYAAYNLMLRSSSPAMTQNEHDRAEYRAQAGLWLQKAEKLTRSARMPSQMPPIGIYA